MESLSSKRFQKSWPDAQFYLREVSDHFQSGAVSLDNPLKIDPVL
ncbi:hypothetical protein [Metabacillus indicus]